MHGMAGIYTNIKASTMSRTEFWLLLIIAALALYILYFHLNASITRVIHKGRSSQTRIYKEHGLRDIGQVTLDNSRNIGIMRIDDTYIGLHNNPSRMDRERATTSVRICTPVHSGCLQYVDKDVGRSPNGRVVLAREKENMERGTEDDGGRTFVS